MSKPETVGRHKVVSMQYSLTNTDGVVVREASGAPVTYLHGAGLLFPKLENELESHTIGDIVTARLLPDDAFGKRIEVGGKIVGSDEDGNEVSFLVTGIEGGSVSLDGNHPFAGQSLVFEVEIQAIRDATAEEIRQQQVIG